MNKLIQLTGVSCTGKDTILPLLDTRLEKEGYRVILLQEPSVLRADIKTYRRQQNRNPYVEAALFSTDRYLTYARLTKQEGVILLSNRGLIDSVVNQGLIGGVPIETVLAMNASAPKPDLSIVLTVSGEEGERRARQRQERGGEIMSINETGEAIKRTANLYLKAKEILKEWNLLYIDTTNLTPEQVADKCWAGVSNVLKR